jgi:hypothetical protein
MEEATRPDPIGDFARVIATYRKALFEAGIRDTTMLDPLVLDFQRALLARGIGIEFKRGAVTDVRGEVDKALREVMLTRVNHWH